MSKKREDLTTLKVGTKQVCILDNAECVVEAVANHFCQLAGNAITRRDCFTVALSGGTTPKALYLLLSTPAYSTRVQWDKVLFFLGDERCVPHDHPDSNFGMVKSTLLSASFIPPNNVFATQGQDKDPELAAMEYEARIRHVFGGVEIPSFDLILLGLGEDGHTASLFPGSEALKEKRRVFVANYVEKLDVFRLSITLPVINRAREVLVLACGQAKAEILARVFYGTSNAFPSQLVEPQSGNLIWFIDKAAAANLSGGSNNG